VKLTSAGRLLVALVVVAVIVELERCGVLGLLEQMRGSPKR